MAILVRGDTLGDFETHTIGGATTRLKRVVRMGIAGSVVVVGNFRVLIEQPTI